MQTLEYLKGNRMNWLSTFSKTYIKSQGIIDIYGTILYSDINAHVKKVLEDDDYWRSFDSASGPRWFIFACRTLKGKFVLPNSRPGSISYMVPMYIEPDKNKELLSDLEISSSREFPLFLLLMEDSNGEIQKATFSIDESTIESTYNSIKQTILLVTDIFENIHIDNLGNKQEILELVNNEIKNAKELHVLKRGFEIMKEIKGLL